MSDYEIVQRPSKPARLLFYRADGEYPIEAICASADTGNAVRIYVKDAETKLDSKPRNPEKPPTKRWSRRGRAVDLIRGAVARRGYTMEWSRDPTSIDHILVWAVRREEG